MWYNVNTNFIKEVCSVKITVVTKTGSVYSFYQENGKDFFKKGGTAIGGRILRMRNGPISIGGHIDIDFVKYDADAEDEEELMYLRSTTVKEISVSLE